MQHDEVAIIGAAGLFPGAADLTEFHERLRTGYDGIGQPGPDRVRHTGGALGTSYLPMGYLDRVDLFDHAFFGISRREAELMDPHQRLALQLAHRAVEHAGYAPGRLRGSRTAVVLAEVDPTYEGLVPKDDPQHILGTLPAAVAARVSYLLDLAGPSLVVDSACSSALAAVAQAVRLLRCGDADLALAGGLSVQTALTPDQGRETLRGVESPTGTCLPFDARADGTVGGEGGGIVLLKPLSRALADRDTVLGVLKGIAVNHNGYRAASMGAPSQAAQAEVIAAAWRDAGVEAGSVGYVECHGSATPLGDVVEVEALRQAFGDAGATTPCVIGSVKGDIGHLGNAAGIVGLLKALGSVRHGVLYPSAHFAEANPLIDLRGPVRVDPAGGAWPRGATPRRAGVSSFGLTGTNVHAVLEEPPEPPADDGPGAGAELVTVSARSASALDRYRHLLADFAETTGHSLRAVAHTLNRGRDDHPFRLACTAADVRELARALRSAALPDDARPVPERGVVLVFSADAAIDGSDWARLAAEEPALHVAQDGPDAAGTGPRGLLLLRRLALYRLLASWGVRDPHFVGSGDGTLAVRAAQGELSARDAALAAAAAPAPVPLDPARLREVAQGFRRDGAVLVEMAADGVLTREIRRVAPDLPVVTLLGGEGRRGLLDRLGHIYTAGGALDWERHYAATDPGPRTRPAGRVEAPTYPFEPVRCWVRESPAPQAPPSAPAPAPAARPAGPSSADTPAGPAVVEVWEEVLGATGVHPDSDYFALGGTSISGISVLRRLERDLGVRLTFADLYAHRTAGGLARRVEELRSRGDVPDTGRSVVPVPRGGRLPLSFGQEQLWYLDRLHPGSPLYNIPADLRLRGPLDVAALRGALDDLSARHEVLRTCVRDDDGEPYVHVLPAGPDLPLTDLGALPPARREEEARRLAGAEAVRPFDLAAGPLLRTALLRLADDDHVLLYTYHHIVFDGWSPAVFFRDLFELYRARCTGRPAGLPALPVQYADFAAWQRSWLTGDRLEAGLAFWRKELAGLRTAPLPLDRPRPAAQDFRGDLVEFTIDAGRARAVRAYSREQGVTTFVTMLALVDVLLHHWTGTDDVVVGVGTSGRVDPATHGLIGYFNNLPPFRTRIGGDLTFTDVVRRCADTVAGVLDHEDMPFEKIVSAVCRTREPGRHPLYDVAYTYQNAPAPAHVPAGLEITRLLDRDIAGIAPGTAKFDLTFGVTDQDDGPMHAYVEYAVALFDRETVQGLTAWLPALLGAVLEDPGRRVADLPPAPPRAGVPRSAAPRPSVLTGAPYAAGGGLLVHEEVAARAAERPDHPAVVAHGRTYTYREVDAMADRLARRLVTAGVGPESTVPVVAGRGPGLVVGWLAVARAGGAFVLVDPDWPRQRIEDVLADLEATGGAVTVLGDLPGRPCTPIDLTDPGTDGGGALPRRSGPRDLAYVAYTSGSTGRPHGCEIEHRNLAALVRWYQDELELTPDDRVLQVASPGFDAAVLDVWPALCRGATLHFAPTALEEPGAFLRRLADRRVTAAFLPTQLAEIVLSEGEWPPDLRLRVLATGGDRLRVSPPPGCPFRLVNMYGPTECTVVSTAGGVDPATDGASFAGGTSFAGGAPIVGGASLPAIGRPVAGASVGLLDGTGQPVQAGDTGEITVGGAAVGRGYRGLPGLTAARFVADPHATEPGARRYRTGDLGRLRPDGTVEFTGRLDDQAEIGGRRVEPAEAERVLLTHPAVREAAVVDVTAPSGSTRLVAHVAAGPSAPAGHELLDWTARALPAFMVPSAVVPHERLPRTGTGKLDRRSLREMAMPTTAPRTPTAPVPAAPVVTTAGAAGGTAERAEDVLVRIVADLLVVDGVRADDNFFELGGDSVLGVRVAARAAKSGVHFTPQQMLQHHSLRELAAAATVDPPGPPPGNAAAAGGAALPAAAAPPVGAPRLTPIMRGFLERMPPGAPDFLEVHPLETTTRISGEIMRTAVEHLLARHETLRYRFRRNGLGWRIECAEPAACDVFDTQVLPALDEEEEREYLARDLEQLRSLIDLERGPVLRVRHYDRGHGRGGRLVLVIHHFVFDNIATVVLIDDLDAALTELLAGRPLPPPEPSLTWREWSRHLQDMADSDELAGELAYWTGTLRSGAALLTEPPPRHHPGGVARRRLAPDQVASVLKGGPGAEEAALCAFACALARWSGTTGAYVMTEGAATPNVYRPAGRSPAIGWFTSVHPLMLPVDPAAGVRDNLPTVTDRVRSVPNDGVGYGILRHLTPATPVLAPLRALPEPEVLVIHGTHDGSGFDTGVTLLRNNRSDGFARAPKRMPEAFPLVLTTTVTGGALQLILLYDGRRTEQEAEALADETVRAFAELAG
ncbi:non-ribosomal peptide synthetase [Streptomyces beigongshangae]|uniref:non-ribosomal peptide synthetase n=1 Tax=Streptomyces beigongshangae TaxID=2841597 RepID=UPI001C8550F2|nr:non-ribosomal peptide synthetase [Streptomyces sp. REN17]